MSLSKLKELAKLRTSGKWESHSQDSDIYKNFMLVPSVPCYEKDIIGMALSNEDAEFIAALVNSSERIFEVVVAAKELDAAMTVGKAGDWQNIYEVQEPLVIKLEKALKELEEK